MSATMIRNPTHTVLSKISFVASYAHVLVVVVGGGGGGGGDGGGGGWW